MELAVDPRLGWKRALELARGVHSWFVKGEPSEGEGAVGVEAPESPPALDFAGLDMLARILRIRRTEA
jgi:hypothetical protein